MLFKRVEADEKKGKENIQWINYILKLCLLIITKWFISATNMTPSKARKNENEFRARLNVSMKARKDGFIQS